MPIPAPRQHFRKCTQCGNPYSVPIGPGRPRAHCSDKCRYASRTSGPPDHAEQDQDLQTATHDLQLEVTRLISQQLSEPPTHEILQQLLAIENLVEDAKAAAVARGRARGESWKDMATGTGSSPDHLRKRWTPDRVTRRLARVRTARAARPTPGIPAQRTATHTGHPAGDHTHDSPDHIPLKPTQTPRQQLACALSFLQRKTARSIKETALDMGISPSHLSRLLAGSRGPSWDVVRQFAAVCEADLTVLRVLWEDAQRPPSHSPAPPPADPAAAARQLWLSLKSLHLAADSPDLGTIRKVCSLGAGRPLNTGEIARILKGDHVPDWETTARIILALRGRPAELRALWQATQPTPQTRDDPDEQPVPARTEPEPEP
ncbi:helix-turn-helix domain-containing protein [Streptomyces lavendulae]|uniref:helix-turn-helix domain-containing protein n=1 Tax=Streptomyces lavendulae TaxID=1914 RepID=UPI00367C6BD4